MRIFDGCERGNIEVVRVQVGNFQGTFSQGSRTSFIGHGHLDGIIITGPRSTKEELEGVEVVSISHERLGECLIRKYFDGLAFLQDSVGIRKRYESKEAEKDQENG